MLISLGKGPGTQAQSDLSPRICGLSDRADGRNALPMKRPSRDTLDGLGEVHVLDISNRNRSTCYLDASFPPDAGGFISPVFREAYLGLVSSRIKAPEAQ